MDQYDLISLFVAPLNALGIEYMITGSVASGMYSSPRYTNDVDLVITINGTDVSRLHHCFDNSDYYVPPIEVIEVERVRRTNGHFNVIHNESGFKADIFFPGDNRIIQWGLANRRSVTSDDGQSIWLAPIEYIILLKLIYMRDGGSLKHIEDINAMLKMQEHSIDEEMLMREINDLGLTETWKKLNSTKQ